MRHWGALVALLALSVVVWPSVIEAQSTVGSTPTPEPPTATATVGPTIPTSVGETPTMPPMTPIPTVVLQLSDILSTTAQVAAQQRDAWALSSPTSPLFVGLGALVLVIGLLLFLIQQVRP